MTIIDLRGNTVAPHNHLATTNDQDEDGVEDWLSGLLNQRANISHSHPATIAVTKNFVTGLAVNTWTVLVAANILKKYKVYCLKILIESGSNWPYSAAGVLTFATTNCNGSSTQWRTILMAHNAAVGNATIRASGGAQTSPAIGIQFPFALPANSTVTAEFLELF